MIQEITYYPPDRETGLPAIPVLKDKYEMPSQRQLNIALAAAGVAIIIAIVLGYFAFTMQDQKAAKKTNAQTQTINDNL